MREGYFFPCTCFLELFANQFPAGTVLVHAPDGDRGFGPELTASEVLHLRLAALDGHYFALAAISRLSKSFQTWPGFTSIPSFVMLSAVVGMSVFLPIGGQAHAGQV